MGGTLQIPSQRFGLGSGVTIGSKDAAYGKWSPNWHVPYRVDQFLPGNAYMLEELDGIKFPVAINGQHLKKYFPSMWDGGQ
jgi:hypothetical protein